MTHTVNILIADDSESMRMAISETLKSADYRVTEAINGEIALKLAKTAQFDAVITDINMPVMDGVKLIEHLRELPGYRHTPILMLTTESSDEKKGQGKAAGATGWITKPFSPDKLLTALNKLIAKRRPAMMA